MGAGAKRQDPPGMEGVYNSSLPGTSEGDRLIQGASSLMLTPTPGSPTRPGTALARRPATARPQTATTARSACTGTPYSWQRNVKLCMSLSTTWLHVTAYQKVVQWSVATAQRNGVALMSLDTIPARWNETIRLTQCLPVGMPPSASCHHNGEPLLGFSPHSQHENKSKRHHSVLHLCTSDSLQYVATVVKH